jgi:hypothetical protein
MLVELSTLTLTAEGGAEGAAVIVEATVEAVRLSPPASEAVTVIEYSVPSSRPVSVWVVPLAGMPLSESVKQSVLVLE